MINKTFFSRPLFLFMHLEKGQILCVLSSDSTCIAQIRHNWQNEWNGQKSTNSGWVDGDYCSFWISQDSKLLRIRVYWANKSFKVLVSSEGKRKSDFAGNTSRSSSCFFVFLGGGLLGICILCFSFYEYLFKKKQNATPAAVASGCWSGVYIYNGKSVRLPFCTWASAI